jgi:hypothetical protein
LAGSDVVALCSDAEVAVRSAEVGSQVLHAVNREITAESPAPVLGGDGQFEVDHLATISPDITKAVTDNFRLIENAEPGLFAKVG